ncbi:MAG: catalase [Lachnospiraceae bacterium]|nr:catalase [Lachnospiraceae bacterium]
MKWWSHLKTINHHKWLVMKHCFRCGLYMQGLLHDMSKYSWTEFSVGVKYYQGDRSPNNAEREDKGYTSAWLHHKGRNKHHLEYWIDYGLEDGQTMVGMEMPVKYVVEMFCDRVAASKTYHPETYTDQAALIYYEKGKDKYIMHPNTRKLLEELLQMLAERGEDETFSYIRQEILHNQKKTDSSGNK